MKCDLFVTREPRSIGYFTISKMSIKVPPEVAYCNKHIVQDSAFKLIMPPCSLSLKLNIQKDNWYIGLNSQILLTLRSSINQDNDTRMLMHFSIDPVMTVASGVRVGNFRTKCLLFMWVSKLHCMSLTRTLSNQQAVKLLLVIVVAQSS